MIEVNVEASDEELYALQNAIRKVIHDAARDAARSGEVVRLIAITICGAHAAIGVAAGLMQCLREAVNADDPSRGVVRLERNMVPDDSYCIQAALSAVLPDPDEDPKAVELTALAAKLYPHKEGLQ